MILEALTRAYEAMCEQGEAPNVGWGRIKISYTLALNESGELTALIPLLVEAQSGKKTVLRPRMMELPAAVKRASDVSANFLWDNSAYMLGIDNKDKPGRTARCFEEAGKLHHKVLDGVDSPAARGILRFFDSWNPSCALENQIIKDHVEELMAGVNIVFRVNGQFPTSDEAVVNAWQSYYNAAEGERITCLVTGKEDTLSLVHPAIAGVRDAQSSGAALVSFNAPAFCSYSRDSEQGMNAPVGRYAAFAYTTALNTLLMRRENVQFIGDATVVCWAEGAEPQYASFAMSALFGMPNEGFTNDELHAAVKRLAEGKRCESLCLDPAREFFILGLSPNAARLSVRFFLRNTFGKLMENVNAHNERMEIVRPANDAFETLPLWAMLRETVNMNARDKLPSPVMAGAVMRAVFTGTPYPASLLQSTVLRIRAEHAITRGRAAIPLNAFGEHMKKHVERHAANTLMRRRYPEPMSAAWKGCGHGKIVGRRQNALGCQNRTER